MCERIHPENGRGHKHVSQKLTKSAEGLDAKPSDYAHIRMIDFQFSWEISQRWIVIEEWNLYMPFLIQLTISDTLMTQNPDFSKK